MHYFTYMSDKEVVSEDTSQALGYPKGESVLYNTSQRYLISENEVMLDFNLFEWFNTVTGVFYEYRKSFDEDLHSNAQTFSTTSVLA